MDFLRWDVVLAVLGVAIPIAAALWEFVFVGRKRLGYRVQMDTTASDEVHSAYAGALQQLRRTGGGRLVDPSFVLLRIENVGATLIDEQDYAALGADDIGIRVDFPGRRVAGAVVTELSHEFLRPCFEGEHGMRVRDNAILLPKVPLNRSAHYKVLAALERDPAVTTPPGRPFADPHVVGGVKGGVGSGTIRKTESHTGISRPAAALICFLVVLLVAQLLFSLNGREEARAAPGDCASGSLTLTGSTAFRPVLEAAAAGYEETCTDAHIDVETRASGEGLEELNRAGEQAGPDGPAMLAFSDGPKEDGFTRLLPRPVAFSLFTLVVNEDIGVLDLTLDQIRALYEGTLGNWAEAGGPDQPVRLVSRGIDSGTRRTFERHVLGFREPITATSDDCETLGAGAAGDVVRCEENETPDVLDEVASTPGAIGYAELGAATAHDGLRLLRIGGNAATLEAAVQGAYPFWETEYAYSYGDPPTDSLAAGFLRYLTDGVGKDIIRSPSQRPCAEMDNPLLCRPA
ncbi:PstS family phosphate ABC transporter substrate-binding protein [Streptomyces hoynatensis]|uniref:Phosphate ABC transporter substrate-binding protein n=1 Tax=Streptomyces hoynatensis TaxID=1141874 RepID=A0A3A9YJJ3_9ACTN|nr:substrate-binding domain-containing protein [Streptomyces hoynatensis]RKN36890.1 phosphate ABC transporter substrate-binding protein [Streptomyces hoynatensis]